jgi:hypothetical protein
MDLVEIGRKRSRKDRNNVRGAIGRDVFSVLHYSKAHYLPDCKSRGKLKEKGVRIPGTGSVFQNSMFEDVLYGVFSIV